MCSMIRLLTLVLGMLLAIRAYCEQEFTPDAGEIIRNIVYTDHQILVGSSGAVYRVDPGILNVVERRPLLTPNRLLVADTGGSFNGQLLTCDHSVCFLANSMDFSNVSWSVPRNTIFRDGQDSVVGLFTPSLAGTSELLFGENANGFFGRRFIRGAFKNVNLTGPNPPDNSEFLVTAEKTETSNGEVYQHYTQFLHNDYIYFVTDTVMGEVTPLPAGRVVRFCRNDSGTTRGMNFGSYFELRLGCSSSTTITAATFINSSPFLQPTIVITSRSESNDMHMCAYSVETIDQLMLEKYTQCIGGIGQTAFARDSFPAITRKCKVIPGTTSNVCNVPGDLRRGLEVGPTLHSSFLVSRNFPGNEVITSLTSLILAGNLYLFAGSSMPKLHQFVITSNSTAVYIRNTTIKESAATNITHLLPSADGEHVYAGTPNKIVKHPVNQCSLSKSCTECLTTGDNLCGWCALRGKCVRQMDCTPVNDDSNIRQTIFLETESKCPVISSATPDVVHLELLKDSLTITLVTSNILSVPAALNFTYFCIFTFLSPSTGDPVSKRAMENVGDQSFMCFSPVLTEIPAIPAGTDTVMSSISLQPTLIDSPLVTTTIPISFTNCSVHISCASCLASGIVKCKWCPLSFACISDLESLSTCPSNLDLQLIELPRNTCNTNILPHPNTTSYLVHANFQYVYNPLQVFSEGLDIFISNVQFSCRVCETPGCSEGSFVMKVSASLLNNIVICQFNEFPYSTLSEEHPMVRLTLQVLVNNFVIDNPRGAEVIVYGCSFLGSNCAQCLSIDTTNLNTFGCSYCGTMTGLPGNCLLTSERNNECFGKTIFSGINDCDTPSITNFFPKNGPTEGGTEISVSGKNLGVLQSHITGVTIGGVPCTLTSYRPGIGFNCTSGSMAISLASRPITALLSFPPFEVTSSIEFSYLAPSLNHPPATPQRGPASGGTLITIRGMNIGIGSKHSVLLRSKDCRVTAVTQYTIQCLTPPSDFSSSNNILRVFVDEWAASDSGFDYSTDPTFTSIEPMVSFFSGGTWYTVNGQNLDVVVKPRLIIYIEGVVSRRKRQESVVMVELISEPCVSISSTHIQCLAPPLNNILQDSSVVAEIGLIMDGVTSLLSLNESITIFPDPIIKQFESIQVFDQGQDFTLVIEGDMFQFSADQLTISISPCNSIPCTCDNTRIITSNQSIVCDISDPLDLPVSIDLTVTVHVGFFNSSAGQIRIDPNLQLLIILVPIFAFFIIFCVVVFIVLFAVFYRKAQQKDQRYGQLMLELEKLESSVARECKLGFAELQTDLDELTGDVAECRLPYHHLQLYLLSTLFPGSKDHPIMHPPVLPAYKRLPMQSALREFNELLNDHKILLFLIQTMEEQRSFTIRDKSIVGSLLMVVLHSRMDYTTDVLKKLLSQLIRKTVTNSNPKLLLRRTESVAEKMLTNWLTLCLHGYVMDHVGKPMYMLYRAVKSQLEKGPVDVITGEARYSLSEQKLIRQKVDVTPINATVEMEDGLRVPVKLLDCDTISQAKEKLLDSMFRAAPVSKRPKLTEMDLEYLKSSCESVLLRDDDHTTVIEGSWKSINTLRHYWVHEGAMFRMQRRKELPPPGRVYDYLGSIYSSHNQYQRAMSEAEDGFRVWHLFKQMESEDPRKSPFLNKNKKMVSEIYLPRMLSTKSILQNFVDELFTALFSISHAPPTPTNFFSAGFPLSPIPHISMGYAPGTDTVPMAIKYLFDFLDDEADIYKIVDSDVVHTWKNNALSLRFWVNMIKNPEFVFDINKSQTVDACLSVIAQAFIDGCSPGEMKLTIDSPTSKLLYNKEVQGYKLKVKKYYSNVKQLPKISEEAMQLYMRQLSEYQCQQMKAAGGFDMESALHQLLSYATQYSEPFLHTLRTAGLQHRAMQFERILQQTSSSNTSTLI